MGAKVFGDWEGALKKLDEFPGKLKKALQQATLQNSVGLVGAIKEGIINQAPGGQSFAPLHPFTVAMRLEGLSAKRTVKAGATAKALINHGDLLAAITYELSADQLSSRVGVTRKARTQDGKSVADIALIQTEGRVIEVTEGMRAFFHSNGFHLKADTTHIIIPPRPFIEPAWRAYRETAKKRYQAAIRSVG